MLPKWYCFLLVDYTLFTHNTRTIDALFQALPFGMISLSSSCLLSASFRFLSRNYLVTTSIPIHYYPVLSPYPLPVYPSPLHPPPKNRTKMRFFFAQSKIIHYLCRRIENMINKKSIRFYNDHKVRAIWSEELNPWVHSRLQMFGYSELLRSAITDQIYDREIFMKGIDNSYYYEEQS